MKRVLYVLVLFSVGILALIHLACSSNSGSSSNPTSPSAPTTISTAATIATGTSTSTTTATFSSTPLNSPTVTRTATSTATNSPVLTATSTLTPSATASNSPTASPTVSFTPTNTATGTSTNTATRTPTPTNSATFTNTPTATSTHYYTSAVTISGSGLSNPIGVQFVSGGNLWISSFLSNSLEEWPAAGGSYEMDITTFNGQSFSDAYSVSWDPSTGNIYQTDKGGSCVVVFNSSGGYLTTFGNGQYSGVAVNAAGTTVYAVSPISNSCNAWTITPGTTPSFSNEITFGNSGTGKLTAAQLMTTDSNNNVWVCDNQRVVEYNSAGVYQNAVTLTSSPQADGVAVDTAGDLFVTDANNNYVVQFNNAGTQLNTFGSGIFNHPYGITIDNTSGTVYVSDYVNSRVVGFQRN